MLECKDIEEVSYAYDRHLSSLDRAIEQSSKLEKAREGSLAEVKQITFESLQTLSSIAGAYDLRSPDSLIANYSKIVSLENIDNKPRHTLETSLESFVLFIEKILVKLKNLLVLFLRKFRDWFVILARLSQTIKTDAEDLVKSLSRARNEISYFPDILKDAPADEFIQWLNLKYPITKFAESSLIFKNHNDKYLGRNLQLLPYREFNYEYPSIDKLSLGSYSDFGDSLLDFYSSVDINTSRDILTSNNELGDLILEKIYPKEEDRLKYICKVYAVDFKHAYYLLIRTYEKKRTKIDFNKFDLSQLDIRVMNPTGSQVNGMFGGNITNYIVDTCRMISRDVNKTIMSSNRVSSVLNKMKSEVDKMIYNYRTVSTSEVVKDNLSVYSKLINRLISNYYYTNITSSFKCYRSLLKICSRLYSDLAVSAGIIRKED